jgi:hypothetical protein
MIMFVRRAGFGPSSIIVLAVLIAAVESQPALSQVVLNEVHTVAAATTGVPVEETFSVATAGTYTVTLTDLGASLPTPAPLASVKLAVTNSSDEVVGTPLVGAGTLTLSSLSAGSYQIHVVGMPGNTPGSGPIGLEVENSGATQIASFQDTIALPSQQLPNGEGALDGHFTVSASGNYTVTLSDLQLPQSLSTLSLLLVPQGGSPLVTLAMAGQSTVALTAGVTYDIFAVGAAASSTSGGLFSATVTPSGGGAAVFAQAIAVGTTTQVANPALAAGSDKLVLNDLSYPAALSQLGAVLLLNGQPVATLSAAGSQTFTASAGTYNLFAAGTAPTASPGAGSYAVQISPAGGGAFLFGAARPVVAAGSTLSPYSFDTSLSAAGSYAAELVDFQFPTALSSLRLAAVQNGALLGTPLAAAGKITMNGAAGAVSLIAFAQAAGGGGLFGIGVSPAAGGAAVYGVTQGVGAVFSSQQFSITAARSYSVVTNDLGFPATFANYDTIVTQGTQAAAKVYGSSSVNFPATSGTYFVNVLAQPTGSDEAGTYAIEISPAPSPPTVTLTVDNSKVSSGSTVDLIWSSQNATGCTASGGWSGSQALSGTATSAALTSDTTFTLTCTGAGGSQAQSVSVTVSAASSGGGGGGAIDIDLLAMLSALMFLRMGGTRFNTRLALRK